MTDVICKDMHGRVLNIGDTVSVSGSADLWTWEGYLVGKPRQYCVRNTATGKCDWADASTVKGGL